MRTSSRSWSADASRRRTETLAQMTPEAIYATLTTGDMVQQAKPLSDGDKRAIAEFFGGRPLGAADAGDAKNMTNHCTSNPPINDSSAGSVPSWNGWGKDLANARFQAAGVSPVRFSCNVPAPGMEPPLRSWLHASKFSPESCTFTTSALKADRRAVAVFRALSKRMSTLVYPSMRWSNFL